MNHTEKKLIVIAGPTAVGKSSAAIKIAGHFGGEIVGADSMQIYRGMNIGTAKIRPEEMGGIPHHMLDVAEPEENYSVADYKTAAKGCIDWVLQHGKTPVICGGTGFYIQAVLNDIDFTQEPECACDKDGIPVRKHFADYAAEYGTAALHERLRLVDPVSALRIPAANVKKVIRALEFYELHGMPISEHNRIQALKAQSPHYPHYFFVLTDERQRLYERIDHRVETMFAEGLAEEAEALLKRGIPPESTAMQAIGYRETVLYLKGAVTLDEAKEMIRINTHHYAKRQLTWFKREKNAVWLHVNQCDPAEEIIDYVSRCNENNL